MADRSGLDRTMLHYLAVQQAMASVHRPVHSKITLTYLVTWQTDRCTLRRMAFDWRRYKTPRRPFSKLCSSLLCACCYQLPEWGPHRPTEARLRVLSITQLRAWAHQRSAYAQLSPLYPLRHSHDKIFQALYCFSALQATESWTGPGNEASKIPINQVTTQTIAHTTVDILSLQKEWLITIHTKILLTTLVVLTSFCMSGLAPAARRSSTTLWWPLKLAVHSGVRPSYSECVSGL